MMAALIDLEASDTQFLSGPHLSQDTLATMVLLSEALELSGVNSNDHPSNRGAALGSQGPNVSSSSTDDLGQRFAPAVAVNLEPAISTRSSDAVISDLKTGRYQRQKVHLSSTVASVSSNTQYVNELSKRESSQIKGNDEGAQNVESEPDEEAFIPKKPRRISERKRIQNAAQEAWFQNYQRQQAKAASNFTGVDSEALSVKYLVKQTESQRIISSPREYQVELFERAKEKNIIAVLDTGKPTFTS